MKNRYWALSLLFLSLACNAASQTEFTANIVISEGKVVKDGRILVKGDRYRMEIEDPQGPVVVVQVFPADSLCRVLVPRYKQYFESGLDEGIARMVDPFLAADAMKKYYTCVPDGTESIDGHACVKEAFKYGDTAALYRWTSADLGFPLKILRAGGDDYFTELKNVKLEAVPAEMFVVPAGFTISDWAGIVEQVERDPQIQAKKKAWAAKQPKSTTLKAMLPVGGEFRALVGDGLTIKVTGKTMGSDDLVWSVATRKNGSDQPAAEVIGPDELEFPSASGVSGLVLKCLQGELRSEVSLSGLGKLVLATKTIQQQESGSGIGQSFPENITAVQLRIKSLEVPGESTLPVRIDLTLEKPQDGSGQDESITKRLEPGQETTFKRVGLGAIGGYSLSLIGPGGRAEIELILDYRPSDQQKPF